ncbi:MAG: hypothetical protein WBA83_16740 [Burkholderiaceae bacterium]
MQEDTQLPTTPPLSGADLVTKINAALRTIATDFYGNDDPAARAWPGAVWGHPAQGVWKRRNDANTAWVVEGRLFKAHLPMYLEAEIPTADVGDIHVIGKGPYTWKTSAYRPSIAASIVTYDKTASGLAAENVQAAIDELCTANNPGAKRALNASGSAPIFACRAWANVAGTGTVSLRGSGNISSITYLGTGQYRLNFTAPLPNANFAVVVCGTTEGGTGNKYYGFPVNSSSADLWVLNSAGAFADAPIIEVSVFG